MEPGSRDPPAVHGHRAWFPPGRHQKHHPRNARGRIRWLHLPGSCCATSTRTDPATVADCAWWLGLPLTPVRAARGGPGRPYWPPASSAGSGITMAPEHRCAPGRSPRCPQHAGAAGVRRIPARLPGPLRDAGPGACQTDDPGRRTGLPQDRGLRRANHRHLAAGTGRETAGSRASSMAVPVDDATADRSASHGGCHGRMPEPFARAEAQQPGSTKNAGFRRPPQGETTGTRQRSAWWPRHPVGEDRGAAWSRGGPARWRACGAAARRRPRAAGRRR